MATKEFLKLTLPGDMAFLPIAQHCVTELGRRIGFPQEDLYKFEVALEECVSNVVRHAFGGGESGSFDILAERVPLGMRVIVREKGLPFDPTLLPQYQPGQDLAATPESGLGIYLMRKSMDEVSFRNMGMEGKETHLVKYLPGRKAGEAAGEGAAAPEAASAEPAVIQEKIAYDVRDLQPSEAIEVTRCAYKSHGYTFFDEHIYYPDRLIELNRSGQMISAVAVTKDNVFMGHAALVYPYPEARIAELTFVFVNVEYRGQGCMNRLCEFLFREPEKKHLDGIYAYAVANHVFTQKVMVKYGINDCGIELATSPQTWFFKGITSEQEGNPQRISVVLGFKYLSPPPGLTLYPPQEHRAMIERLYANLGAKHDYAVPESRPELPAESSAIEVELHVSEQNAEIRIARYGAGVVKEVRAILRDLCLKQAASINLLLNLQDPATPFLVADFERLGFFFSGILPRTGIGEALVLQYLNNVAFDYDKVMVYTDVAREILAYIRERDPNVIR